MNQSENASKPFEKISRVLLLINRVAGTGQADALVNQFNGLLTSCLPNHVTLKLQIATNHAEISARTREFLIESEIPALIIVGGGGGTFRAAIEGTFQAAATQGFPLPGCVSLAPLRMGSGNVLARYFGMPANPVDALRGVIANLLAGRISQCCIMRVEAGTETGAIRTHYAATLGGFGQFGRVPGDLARWHRRFPGFHKAMAGIIGIERLTTIEYAGALLARSLRCSWNLKNAERVVIVTPQERREMRLLSGALLNFPLPVLPFTPDIPAEKEALSLFLIPFERRRQALLLMLANRPMGPQALEFKIGTGDTVTIETMDDQPVEFFLDEDPQTFVRRLRIQVAGIIPLVPGPDYVWKPGAVWTASKLRPLTSDIFL